MKYSNHTALKLMQEQIPGLKESDINRLANLLMEMAREAQKIHSQPDSTVGVEHWVPSPPVVKEVISIGVRVVDIKHCIEDFQGFALSRGWSLMDNLDAKFITHVKIMISKSKITLAVAER